MGGIIAFFASHRVAAGLIMLMMLLGGALGLFRMNIQTYPDFSLDNIVVRTTYDGGFAEDVEQGVTSPLEQRLRGIADLKRMTSVSVQGTSEILLEFAEGTDLGFAFDDVRQQVAAFTSLPTEAKEPRVYRAQHYEPVARVLLAGDVRPEALWSLARRFKDELLSAGIDRVKIIGLPEQQVSIEVPREYLAELDLSLPEVADRLADMSVNIPAGLLGHDDGARELRAVEQRRGAENFADVTILGDKRTHLALDDFAIIRQETRPNQVNLSQHGQPAVELQLQRTKNGNSLAAARILREWFGNARGQLPQSVRLEVYDQEWELLHDRIWLLITNGLAGLVMVMGLLYLFLPARVALWVAVGIPTAFLGTMLVFWGIGGSINMISLFALIMALGVIVDDAIVVGEDADAHFRAGEPARHASVGAARRMWWPVLASSLTTIAAFTPLLLINGIVGKILKDIPVVMICVLVTSIVECFLVLPRHLRNAFLPYKENDGKEQPVRKVFEYHFENFREGSFRRFSQLVLQYRSVTLAIVAFLVLFVFGLVMSNRLPFYFFPTPAPNILLANVKFVTGTPRAQVEKYLEDMEEALMKADGKLGGETVDHAVIRAGTTMSADPDNIGASYGENLGSILVELTNPDTRSVDNQEIIQAWRDQLANAGGLDSLSIEERREGPPGKAVSIRLTGDDVHNLDQGAEELAQGLAQLIGVYDPTDDLSWGREQLIYSVNATGEALGLTTMELGTQLRAAFDGALVQTYQQGEDEIEVRVLLPEEQRKHVGALSQLLIRVPDGRLVPIEQVMDVQYEQGFDALHHADGNLAVEVSVNLDDKVTTAGDVIDALETSALPEIARRYHLSYSFEGQAIYQRETLAGLQIGLVVGLGLMYAVLAWVFASWSLPVIVMATIPLALIGALLGHWILKLDLTVLSLFGLFGLSGIVVNNAIILVAFYRSQRAKGLEINEALVEAMVQRVRAVMLTTLTTIGGLMPLLFETSLQAQFLIPMAMTIAFGLGLSTLLVLAVIPALLSYHEQLCQAHPLGDQASSRG